MTRLPFGGKSPAALPWKPLPMMEDFLETLDDAHSDQYILTSRLGLVHFARFAETENITHPDEIERRHLIRYQAYLRKQISWKGTLLSASYQDQLMKYLRRWFNWMLAEGFLDRNPWVDIPNVRRVRKIKMLSPEEVELLFDTHRRQAFTISPFYYHRREVILALLYGWGLKLQELANLTVTSMDMRQEWVTIRSGERSRTLPYSDELKQVIQRWLRVRSAHAKPGEDALLVDQEGKRLSDQMIKKIVGDLGQRAGITSSPQRLRGSFGSQMLQSGTELEHVMKIMGHSKKDKTRLYAQTGDPAVKEAHEKVMGPKLNTLLEGRKPDGTA